MTIDELYRIIDVQSCRGYRLTDNECGLPYIERKDITEEQPGIFVIRFRLPVGVGRFGLDRVAEDVRREVNGIQEVLVQEKTETYRVNDREFPLRFLDCAWVLSVGQ